MADAAAGSRLQEDEADKRRTKDTVNELLAAVSEEDRILLTLKEVEGLSLKELEKIYHVNENALKVRLFRARQRVLKKHGDVLKTLKEVTGPPSGSAKSNDKTGA